MTTTTALTPLLSLIESPQSSPVHYVVGGVAMTAADRESAAWLVADDAMAVACGNSPALSWWRQRRDGGAQQTGSRLATIQTYVDIAFKQNVNRDHLQGHVAELLWSRLVQERRVSRDGRHLVRAHPVKADPLEPGGDGLVIYMDGHGNLVFRLWEIKKHDATNRVSGTIRRASNQLLNRGHEYLAKLAGPETLIDHDGPLAQLYADMVELWFDRSERAGVGVSVGTSADQAPERATTFRSLQTAFPEFNHPGQVESIVIAIPDFAQFADRVKEIVWSGL